LIFREELPAESKTPLQRILALEAKERPITPVMNIKTLALDGT
jgi:hypothetical protein